MYARAHQNVCHDRLPSHQFRDGGIIAFWTFWADRGEEWQDWLMAWAQEGGREREMSAVAIISRA